MREIDEWDPDRDPSRYATGVGHLVIELYRRLVGAGAEVSLGSATPRHAHLVVLYAVSIEALEARKEALRVLRRTRGRYVLIRGDAPVAFRLPVRPVLDFMPIQGAVKSSNQRWIPPLPQRGLVPRASDRFGRIRSLAFKGNPENVPPEMCQGNWKAELADRGITWWLDVPMRTNGSDQRWHDFRGVDAIVCMRNPAKRRDIERKPATRLINAWLAGCVPIADPEPGYCELGRGEEDVFFVDGTTACLSVLDRLNEDEQLVGRVEASILERRRAFSPAEILARWHTALLEATEAPEVSRWRSSARTCKAAAAQVRGALRRT